MTSTIERTRQAPGSSTAAAGTSPQRPKAPRFEELEAFRGLAALLIVVFHAYQYSRQATAQTAYVYEGTPLHHVFGNLEAGVAWFFALSGFLLFMPIARAAIKQTPAQPARAFLIRRAIRILPLYYLAILTVWAWRYTGGREQWLDLLEHLTFTHIFDRTHLFWTIGPAWSLAVEVHFYIILAFAGPLLNRACGKIGTERSRALFLFAVVAGFGLLGAGYKWWAAFIARIPESNPPAYFGLQAKLDNFALGMLLGVIVAMVGGRQVVGRKGAALLRLTGCSLLVLMFSMRHVDSIPHPISVLELYFHSLSALAFVLVIASTILGPQGSGWAKVLAKPALRYLGLISYSVYLWHEPILIELGRRGLLLNPAPEAFPMNAVILASLAVAVSAVSYWVIELPTMELRHLFASDRRLAQR